MLDQVEALRAKMDEAKAKAHKTIKQALLDLAADAEMAIADFYAEITLRLDALKNGAPEPVRVEVLEPPLGGKLPSAAVPPTFQVPDDVPLGDLV